MVETMGDEEELKTTLNRRYTNIKRHRITRYESIFQGGRYKDGSGSILLNYGDTLGSTSTKEDKIEQVIGFVMAQHYILKAGFKRFWERGWGPCSVLRYRSAT